MHKQLFSIIEVTKEQEASILFALKCILHLLVMILTLVNSGMMYTYYIKSMKVNGAAIATVYNFAINYVGSIVLGALFFNELIT